MTAATDARIAIGFISVPGLAPPAFVHIAADPGCRNIGLALAPVVIAPGRRHHRRDTLCVNGGPVLGGPADV